MVLALTALICPFLHGLKRRSKGEMSVVSDGWCGSCPASALQAEQSAGVDRLAGVLGGVVDDGGQP